MSVTIINFAHGTTFDNEARLCSGWHDVALSPLGVQQAKDLGKQSAEHVFDVVFTSDLSRAIDTAALAWGDTFPVIADARLRECNYGDYDSKPSAEVEPLQEQCITTPMPNGESYNMVEVRMAEFLQDLTKNYDGKYVALVTHKAPQLALEVLINGKTWEQAFAEDWRKTKSWQPGWKYILSQK